MAFVGRCIGFREYGGPEVLTEFDDAKDIDGSDRLVLRTAYSGVNPVDVSFRIGRMDAYVDDKAAGVVPGMECCGEVVASSTPGIAVGTVVNALTLPGATPHAGSWSEYVIADGARAAVVSSALAPEVAACIPLNGVTASSIIADVETDEGLVMITGAAGALGKFLVFACSAAGFTTVALAREGGREAMLQLGADDVVVGDGRVAEYPDPDVIIDATNLGAGLSDRFRSARTVVRVRADAEYPLAHRRLVTANVREAGNVAGSLAWWNDRVAEHSEVVGAVDRYSRKENLLALERLAEPRRRSRVVLQW